MDMKRSFNTEVVSDDDTYPTRAAAAIRGCRRFSDERLRDGAEPAGGGRGDSSEA